MFNHRELGRYKAKCNCRSHNLRMSFATLVLHTETERQT